MAKRVRHDLPAVQEKRARVVELRSHGLTWDAIAAEVGYSNASSASKAWHRAIQARPDMAVDKIRAEAATRYEYLFAEAVRQIEQPGPRVGATSKVAVWPSGHPRAGEIVEDESIRARAIDNARKATGDYVRLTGAELGPSGATLPEVFIIRLAEARAAQEHLDRQAPAIPLPPLPDGYRSMTPQQQMRAELDRRRVHVDAQRAAINAAPDIIDAEIVPD